jgi:hypothetical protein
MWLKTKFVLFIESENVKIFLSWGSTLKRHISIGVFVVYIDTGSSMPGVPSKSRDLADENYKIVTEWKWFETTVVLFFNVWLKCKVMPIMIHGVVSTIQSPYLTTLTNLKLSTIRWKETIWMGEQNDIHQNTTIKHWLWLISRKCFDMLIRDFMKTF